MGVFSGNVSKEVNAVAVMPDGSKKKVDVFFPWSPAAAVGAAQHFIGEREFKNLLFQNGLPWVMVFDGGSDNREDGTVVVAGDLRDPDALMFRNVKGLDDAKKERGTRGLEKAACRRAPGNASKRDRTFIEGKLKGLDILSGATMTFADPSGEFVLYDFYGNVVPARRVASCPFP